MLYTSSGNDGGCATVLMLVLILLAAGWLFVRERMADDLCVEMGYSDAEYWQGIPVCLVLDIDGELHAEALDDDAVPAWPWELLRGRHASGLRQ